MIAILVEASPSDIWVYDLESGRCERLTFGGGENREPVWSWDGNRIAFSHQEDRIVMPMVKDVDTGAEAAPLVPGLQGRPSSWSRDGRLVVFTRSEGGVVVVDLSDGTTHDVEPSPAWGGVLSPDGRLIAYTSGVSGEYQIFVEPFPPTGLRRQVSREGGSEEAIWSRDGTRLYFRSGQRIMTATVTNGDDLAVGIPAVAYRGDFVNVGGRSYDVGPDGRFLVIEGPPGTTTRLNVVLNWTEELRSRFGGTP